MVERLITHLRHVDLASPQFAKLHDFYSGLWGLTDVERDGSLAFLAAEGSPEPYIVRLRAAEEKRIDLLAFGAARAEDVDVLAQQLGADGVRLVDEPHALDTPNGGYGFRFFDNEGRTVEVSSDVEPRVHRVVEEGESIPVRLSHVVVNSTDPEGTVAFYERHLGFALSDTLSHPRMGNMMWFLRVNAWHHSLAIAARPARPRCTTPPSRCAASTSTSAALGDYCPRGSRSSGVPEGTSRVTTPSAISSIPTATPSSTRLNSSASTRTRGTRTSTTSPNQRSPISGGRRTR